MNTFLGRAEREKDLDIIHQLQLDTNMKLTNRYRTIARQMKVIFLYPIAYFLLWIFPMIQNSMRIRGGVNFGITCIAAFIQPLNGCIDSLVFFYREKPWRLTAYRSNDGLKLSAWRRWCQWLPLFEIPLTTVELMSDSKRNTTDEDDISMDFLDFLKQGPVGSA
jgi:G protein-coupled receptor GPR1